MITGFSEFEQSNSSEKNLNEDSNYFLRWTNMCVIF